MTVARLIYAALASLDGYVADEDGRFDWAEPTPEVHAFVNDLERPVGTALYVFDDLPDKGVRLTLNVSVDYALRAWILGFGPFARVESPAALAEAILEQLEEARDAYAPRLDLALPRRVFGEQPHLPGVRVAAPS